jgi:methionyl-tRNA formyltransferase
MDKLKLIFMGTPEFAVPSLETLLKSGHDVVAVVTAVDKPGGRGLRVKPSPVKRFAQLQLVPVLQPESLQDAAFLEELRRFAADLYVVVGFRILPDAVFTLPPLGTVNLHASLLPKYRGAAPINWAVINGDSESGLSTFFIEKKVDTGNIILQERHPIGPDQTAGELYCEMSTVGAGLLLRTVNLIAAGKAPCIQQQGESTRAPKLTREICEIQWQEPAKKIHNLIRGLSPHPCAFTYINGKLLKIYRSKLSQLADCTGSAGEVVRAVRKTGDIFVVCGDGTTISLKDVQIECKKRMLTGDFLLGNQIEAGTKLGV